MLSLYEILKVSKTGIATDMWTALAGRNWGGAESGHEIKELTGIPPLSFDADGTPLLDFLISGNMAQTGTPTPSSPIQPSETGDRTGNLWNYTIEQGGWNAATGTIPTKLVPSDTNYPIRCRIDSIVPIPSRIMSLTCSDGIKINFVWIDANGVSMGGSGWQRNGSTVTAPSDATDLTFILAKVDDSNCSPNDFQNIMLNSGSTALPYEPYGYKIPISSGGATTSIYLGEVPTTRRVKKINCKTFEWEVYQAANNKKRFTALLSDGITADTTHPYSICSHIPLGLSGATFTTENCYTINADTKRIYFRLSDDIDTLSALDTFFNEQESKGTPVTIWYVLAEPETSIVNEPLRKIGDYADTVSMEQAGVSIPTNNGSTTVDVETELKPSEMYIKYRG